MQPTTMPSERRFITVPLTSTAASTLEEDSSPRPVWEIEPGSVLIALGILVDRSELEKLFLDHLRQDHRGVRSDVLLHEAVRLCGGRCRFAAAVEQLLDACARRAQRRVDACPMYELAAWWLGVRDVADGRQLATLLWSLARDRRCVVRPLFDMVQGDIWVRALRLLGGRSTPIPTQATHDIKRAG